MTSPILNKMQIDFTMKYFKCKIKMKLDKNHLNIKYSILHFK